MKLLIEINGGTLSRVVASDDGEIELFVIDHDNLKAGDDPASICIPEKLDLILTPGEVEYIVNDIATQYTVKNKVIDEP